MSAASTPIYLPPRRLAAAARWGITRDICERAQQELDQLGHNCLPIVLGDYSCAVGIRAGVTERIYIREIGAVGVSEPAPENHAGQIATDFLEGNSLAMADTPWRTIPTYYKGARQNNIDHIASPVAAKDRRRRFQPLFGLAQRIQLPSTHLRDRVPAFADIDVHISKAHQSQFTSAANRDQAIKETFPKREHVDVDHEGAPRARYLMKGDVWATGSLQRLRITMAENYDDVK
ncbi:unnamed protein product, partial [Prorocentrum cordatum]